MNPLLQEVNALTHGYVRKGSKANRRQQRARMQAFAEHAAAVGARSLGQVGQRHVIQFWKAHRHFAPATAYGYFLAIRELWRLAGKPGEPPRPRMPTEIDDASVGKTPPEGPSVA